MDRLKVLWENICLLAKQLKEHMECSSLLFIKSRLEGNLTSAAFQYTNRLLKAVMGTKRVSGERQC
jgi:hypothetical protein